MKTQKRPEKPLPAEIEPRSYSMIICCMALRETHF